MHLGLCIENSSYLWHLTVDFHKNLGINALNDVDNWIDFAFVFLVIAHYTSNTLKE